VGCCVGVPSVVTAVGVAFGVLLSQAVSNVRAKATTAVIKAGRRVMRRG
jgi:hypothetical protein